MEGTVSPNDELFDEVKEGTILKQRIKYLEEENAQLKQKLTQAKRSAGRTAEKDERLNNNNDIKYGEIKNSSSYEGILSPQQIERYSRQLLLHEGFGVEGQSKLLNSSVLIVGAGGIGSTAILYLAASGVGNITIIDFDEVDISNLHRQVIHKTKDVGLNKAESARRAVENLNPTISCNVVNNPLTATNALDIISSHDCIVDASDNPLTRYLINDACVLSGKPLVSGSAIGTEGQLTVYNYKEGPCYRCLYPRPNLTEGSKSCADNGVLGPVPGLIGILQAVEVIKVITGAGNVLSDRLVMYDSLTCSFLRIKKPPRQPKCLVCGDDATINSMEQSFIASETVRGPGCSVNVKPKSIPESNEISCAEYNEIRKRGDPHVLLDVRVKEQFHLCSIPGAINIPLSSIPDRIKEISDLSGGVKPVYCICRRGIASADATSMILDAANKYPSIYSVKNIASGLDAWRNSIDNSFPKY